MALDHAALLQVLDALKAGDADERIRVAAETMYQTLIDTELTSVIGAPAVLGAIRVEQSLADHGCSLALLALHKMPVHVLSDRDARVSEGFSTSLEAMLGSCAWSCTFRPAPFLVLG